MRVKRDNKVTSTANVKNWNPRRVAGVENFQKCYFYHRRSLSLLEIWDGKNVQVGLYIGIRKANTEDFIYKPSMINSTP